jgi:ubiquinone/menaquinone biosynthesis C-methylase UbiE
MRRNEIFRDTNTIYLGWDNYASKKLLRLAAKYAGKRILDVGCSIGDYCQKLKNSGFSCVGVDYNPKYIEKAREKGVEAYVMDAYNLSFEDKSFDTVLLFEILEHLENPELVLREAKRVAKKNILITTPNFSEFSRLASLKLTYYDVLEEDHVNFFTKEEIANLCNTISSKYMVWADEPIYMHRFLPWYIRKPISLLYTFKVFKPTFYRRLYAVIWIEK